MSFTGREADPRTGPRREQRGGSCSLAVGGASRGHRAWRLQGHMQDGRTLRSEKWWLSESLSHCDVGEGREARYSWPGTR